MKTLSLLFLAASLLFTNSLKASQESPELQEASTLTTSAVKLYNQGKYGEALPLAKRALEIRDKGSRNYLRSYTRSGSSMLVRRWRSSQSRELF